MVPSDPKVTLTELAKALVNGDFVYYYQPKVSMITGELVGAEALIRWIHPSGSIVPPGAFIPLAESTGFICEITLSMFSSLIVDLTIINDLDPDLKVSFNASATDFASSRLIDEIQSAIDQQLVDPDRIEVELTETVMMDEDAAIQDNMRALQRLGISLAMDDFGTGYSTIDTLSRWPFNTLKIDGGGVHRMQQSEKDLTIIQASIRMAHQLGLEVVAEGIETESAYTTLQNAGCRVAQGYLISEPLNLADFIDFIKTGKRWPALPAGLLFMAQLDHIQWRKSAIDAALKICSQAEATHPEPGFPELKSKLCLLGHWYQGAGQTFSDCPSFAGLDAPHKQLHALGAELLERARGGATANQLVPLMRELTNESVEVMAHLQRLEAEILMGQQTDQPPTPPTSGPAT